MKAILIIVACLAVWSPPVGAQEPPAIATLEISLWPEFDRPDLLVIYRGEFAGNIPSPLAVEFRIPSESGKPHAVAYLDEQGQPIQQPYTTRTEDDTIVVAFQLPAKGFQLEYYVPLPVAETEPGTGRRSFTYTYSADYPVAVLNLEVQQPLGAKGFTLEPAADSASPKADGLTYYLTQAGPLAQYESARWSFSYEKTGTGLTVDAFRASQAPDPTTTAAAPEKSKARSGGLLAAGLLAMVAVGAGAFWFGKGSQRAARPGPQPRKRAPSRPIQSPTGEVSFCHQCGVQLRSGVDFCHRCGARVRKS